MFRSSWAVCIHDTFPSLLCSCRAVYLCSNAYVYVLRPFHSYLTVVVHPASPLAGVADTVDGPCRLHLDLLFPFFGTLQVP